MQVALENASEEVLLVYEAGNTLAFDTAGFSAIEYVFTPEDKADGFSSWEKSTSERQQVIEVHSSCRSCAGGYSQQALNRFVAQRVLAVNAKLLVVSGLTGATLDLPQIAHLMGIPCIFVLAPFVEPDGEDDPYFTVCLKSSMSVCQAVFCDPEGATWLAATVENSGVTVLQDESQLSSLITSLGSLEQPATRFDYSLYEWLLRDHPLLTKMQRGEVGHFTGCRSVLDVGCGAGIFLDLLRRENISATGVERNSLVAEYGKSKGLQIATADALAYVETCDTLFDGIYCSHFIEHLPVESVQRLLERLVTCLDEGGTLVLVFPDPESIRSQLLGFWRDPEHVRFYHPELVTTMAAAVDLELVWSSYDEQPHEVASFSSTPPEVDLAEPLQFEASSELSKPLSFLQKLMSHFGLVPASRLERLENHVASVTASLENQARLQYSAMTQLEQRTRDLWKVNQTWSWNDNVTLTFKKRV